MAVSCYCIPNLTKECFQVGTRRSAPEPKLVKSNLLSDGSKDTVDFEWEAQASGGGTYTVTAKGFLADAEAQGIYTDSFQVNCDCPSAADQKIRSLKSNKLYVCKHVAAALESVLDDEAVQRVPQEKKRRAKEAAEYKVKRKKQLDEAKEKQETELPGERERIEYNLAKRKPQDILDIMKERMQTVDGLRSLSTLFPSDIFPTQQTKVCKRCHETYDPQIPSDKWCRIKHPMDQVRTEWEGSKKSWNECEACGKTFNLQGHFGRSRYDPRDEGQYCFEGEHDPEELSDEK